MPEIFFNGPAGRIEGIYQQGKTPDAPLVLILHSLPNENMYHRIPQAMFKTFTALGFSTLVFNFRGVGRSQGCYDPEGIGQLSDAATALDWLQNLNKEAKTCWLVGYSYGAWIGMQLLMRRPEVSGFISICPPANKLDFGFLSPCPASGLIINGGLDETLPTGAVDSLVAKFQQQKCTSVVHKFFPNANHIFENCLKDLCCTVAAFVREALQKKARKVKIKFVKKHTAEENPPNE